MRSSGRHVARAAGTGARVGGEVARRYRERPSSRPTLVALPGEKPEKGAGRREPLDGSKEYADIFGDIPEFAPAEEHIAGEELPVEPEPPIEASELPEAEEEAVTAEVVSGAVELDTSPRPKVEYRLPSPAILKKSAARKGGGDDHREVARKLVDALANF